jgi:hypothetical protein
MYLTKGKTISKQLPPVYQESCFKAVSYLQSIRRFVLRQSVTSSLSGDLFWGSQLPPVHQEICFEAVSYLQCQICFEAVSYLQCIRRVALRQSVTSSLRRAVLKRSSQLPPVYQESCFEAVLEVTDCIKTTLLRLEVTDCLKTTLLIDRR